MMPDFFLGGGVYSKNNVYRNKPSLVDELKMEIEVQICACKCVLENMIGWLDACQEIGWGHFQCNL